MYPILKKQKLAENVYLMQVKAPAAAKNAQPGQFIILQIHEKGERIPLSIADFDKNSITVIFSAVGKSTQELARLKKGNALAHFAGPLGNPTEIMEFGTVCLVGGGFGAAPLYTIAKAMKKAGNKVITVIGSRSKNLLFWEDKLKKESDDLIVMTDDGSKGGKGFVTDALAQVFKRIRLNLVFTIGPPVMMKEVAKITKHRARTIASLALIMLDGTGMCGSCRVNIGGETKFACVDGPDFNAHAVDWNTVIKRNKRYEKEEKHACRCIK